MWNPNEMSKKYNNKSFMYVIGVAVEVGMLAAHTYHYKYLYKINVLWEVYRIIFICKNI